MSDKRILLKPCPFCGGKPKMLSLGPVQCTECGVKGPEGCMTLRLSLYEVSAAIKWNKRADYSPDDLTEVENSVLAR